MTTCQSQELGVATSHWSMGNGDVQGPEQSWDLSRRRRQCLERKILTKLVFPKVGGQWGKKFDKQRQEGKSEGMWRKRNLLTQFPRLKGNRWESIIVERKARCFLTETRKHKAIKWGRRPIHNSAWNWVMSMPNPLAALAFAFVRRFKKLLRAVAAQCLGLMSSSHKANLPWDVFFYHLVEIVGGKAP